MSQLDYNYNNQIHTMNKDRNYQSNREQASSDKKRTSFDDDYNSYRYENDSNADKKTSNQHTIDDQYRFSSYNDTDYEDKSKTSRDNVPRNQYHDNPYPNNHNTQDYQRISYNDSPSTSWQNSNSTPSRSEQQVNNPFQRNQPSYETNKQQFQNQNSKRVTNFTIRDVLNMSIQRQQYLKNLTLEQFKQNPQYSALMSNPSVVLSIISYYQKIIPDKQFYAKASSLKRGNEIKQVLVLTGLIAYTLIAARALNITNPMNQMKFFKGKAHFLIPIGLVTWAFENTIRKNKQISQLVQDQQYEGVISQVLKKYVCQTTKKQKFMIMNHS